jgi:hypothetical protein
LQFNGLTAIGTYDITLSATKANYQGIFKSVSLEIKEATTSITNSAISSGNINAGAYQTAFNTNFAFTNTTTGDLYNTAINDNVS